MIQNEIFFYIFHRYIKTFPLSILYLSWICCSNSKPTYNNIDERNEENNNNNDII